MDLKLIQKITKAISTGDTTEILNLAAEKMLNNGIHSAVIKRDLNGKAEIIYLDRDIIEENEKLKQSLKTIYERISK